MVLTILFLGFWWRFYMVLSPPQILGPGVQPQHDPLTNSGDFLNVRRWNREFPIGKIWFPPTKLMVPKKIDGACNSWSLKSIPDFRDSNGNQSHEISSAEQQVVSCSLCWFGAKQASPLSASQWQLKLFKDAINSLSLHSSLGTTSTEEHNILPNEFWSTHVKQFQDLAASGKTEFQTIVDTGLGVLGCAPGVLWHVSSVMVHLIAGSHRKNVGQQSTMNPAK